MRFVYGHESNPRILEVVIIIAWLSDWAVADSNLAECTPENTQLPGQGFSTGSVLGSDVVKV